MQDGQYEEAKDPGDIIFRMLRDGNKATFTAAKEAIMQKVLQSTIQEAFEDLGNPEDIAQRAFGQVAGKHGSLRDALEILKNRLIEDVACRSTEELADVEATALRAYQRLGQEDKTVLGAQRVLSDRLIDDIAHRATAEIAHSEVTAQKARGRIAEEDEALVRGISVLKEQLIQEVADRSTDQLADAKETAVRAKTLIHHDHPTVLSSIEELKQRLIDEITHRSIDELADVEATARQAQALIGGKHQVILEAVDKLKELVLDTIVRESILSIDSEVRDSLKQGIEVGMISAAPDWTTAKNGSATVDAHEVAEVAFVEEALECVVSNDNRELQEQAENDHPEDVDFLVLSTPEASEAEDDEAGDVVKPVYYVYGIIANNGLTLSNEGIDLEYQTEIIQHQSVAAIAGKIPNSAFGEKNDRWKEDVERIHARIVEQIKVASYTVLPMYDRTTYESQAQIQELLAEHETALKAALEKLAGKWEWNVNVYCDPEKVKQQLQASSETIDTFLSSDQWSRHEGDAELEAFKEGMNMQLSEMIETVLKSCEQMSHRTLNNLSEDSHVFPLAEDNEFDSVQAVLKAIYLVVEEHVEAFESELKRLAKGYDNLGFVYYVEGSYRPYRFTLLETLAF